MTKVPVEVKKQVPATTPAADPWVALRSEMDRVFDRFAGALGLPSFRPLFDFAPMWPTPPATEFSVPAVDVTEDEKGYTIAAELPGIDEKDLDVSLTGDALTIKGEKHAEKEERDKNYYVSERSYGSFRRSFALPENVDRNAVGASFAKGVLTVTLPKTAQARKEAKKIEVKAA